MIAGLAGGALIGGAAPLLLWLDGEIAGISGIVAGLLEGVRGDASWRAAFLAGLLFSGAALELARPALISVSPASFARLAVAGVLVGVGTRLGRGCTSGHGVCGVARGSRRSLVATATFMATGILTVLALGVGKAS